eukprot:g6019.t1
MDRLNSLENALWEAHRREASTATLVETRKMQEAHSLKRAALEADLENRRDRLERSCREQVRALRQAHESRLADINRAEPAIIVARDGGYGGDNPRSSDADPTTTKPRGMTAAVVEVAYRASGAAVTETSVPSRGGNDVTKTGVISTDRDSNGREEAADLVDKRTQAPSITVEAVAATAVAAASARAEVAIVSSRANKALVELRSELGKHMAAVAHVVDGGRHLQEATRVMGEIEKLETLGRLEAEAKPAGDLVMNLERITVQQKQVQAEGVQRDKHERLRRSLECSGTEELRLLAVRQNGALGRLAVRRRAAKHDREAELRGKLAQVKGGVARLWREHNRRNRCGYGPRSSCADEQGGADGKLSGAEGGSRPTPSGGQQHGSFIDVRKYGDRKTTIAIPGGASEEGGDGGCVGKGEKTAERDGQEGEGGDIGTISDDENLSPSGQRGPGDDGMNPDWILRSSFTTTAGGMAAAPPVPASEVDQKKHGETTRTSSLPVPAAMGRGKPGSKPKGAPWRRRKHITTTTTDDVAALAADSAVAATTGDGSFGVLSDVEARALAALGRGAPDDPRLLFSTFPLPPPRRRQRPGPSSRAGPDELKEEGAIKSRPEDNGLVTGVDVDGCGDDDLEGVADGRRATVEAGILRGGKDYEHDEVLERAMDKLARKIQADEEESRRQLGMSLTL